MEAVQYGKSETKRGITSVLAAVFNKYNYTSLPEFNAVLKQYNVLADRGDEGSMMFHKKGLLYRILNHEGIPVGVPIKASAFYMKPTLENLEKNFERSKQHREPLRQKLKAILDETLLEKPSSISNLKDKLAKKNVFTVIRQNAEGRVYGITFVDNNNKSVFNGSDVGRQYSIGSLQPLLFQNNTPDEKVNETSTSHQLTKTPQAKLISKTVKTELPLNHKTTNLLEQLMSPKEQLDNTPYALIKKKKKKKRKVTND